MDIIKSKDFSRSNIYSLLEEGEKFRYVCLKIKSVAVSTMTEDNGEDQFLVQIIDMSHKMFYSEMKERESILQLINATVSHELRNPLSAIIGQV